MMRSKGRGLDIRLGKLVTRTGTTIPPGPITADESPDYNKAKQRPVCHNAHWMISQSEFLQSRRELIIAAVFSALCPLSPPPHMLHLCRKGKKMAAGPHWKRAAERSPHAGYYTAHMSSIWWYTQISFNLLLRLRWESCAC